MNKPTFEKWRMNHLPVIVPKLGINTPCPAEYDFNTEIRVSLPDGTYKRVHYRDCTYVQDGKEIAEEPYRDVTKRVVEVGNMVLFSMKKRGWVAGVVTKISDSSVTVSIDGEKCSANFDSLFIVPLTEEDIVLMKLME